MLMELGFMSNCLSRIYDAQHRESASLVRLRVYFVTVFPPYYAIRG